MVACSLKTAFHCCFQWPYHSGTFLPEVRYQFKLSTICSAKFWTVSGSQEYDSRYVFCRAFWVISEQFLHFLMTWKCARSSKRLWVLRVPIGLNRFQIDNKYIFFLCSRNTGRAGKIYSCACFLLHSRNWLSNPNRNSLAELSTCSLTACTWVDFNIAGISPELAICLSRFGHGYASQCISSLLMCYQVWVCQKSDVWLTVDQKKWETVSCWKCLQMTPGMQSGRRPLGGKRISLASPSKVAWLRSVICLSTRRPVNS